MMPMHIPLAQEAFDWSSLGAFLDRYGLPLMLLAFIGVSAWKGGRYVGQRLLAKEDGLCVLLAVRWVAFLDKLESLLARSIEGQDEIATRCEKMRELHTDPAGPCSNVPLRRAGRAAADCLVALSNGDKAAVERHAETIKQELEST